MQAQFLTIEGGEGVGKTTNIQFVQSILEQHNIPFIQTREPGGTPLAEELRELLLAKRDEPFDPVAELLLMFAARAQHVSQVIKPALASGKWVICDRFTDATFAYQGGGRQLDWQVITQLEQSALNNFKPDKTLLLDVAPEVGMKRAAARSDFDRFESEQMAFFKRVRDAYLKRKNDDPERFLMIDASKDLVTVQSSIKQSLERFIKQVKHG
jgi:dTMP kinase